MQCLPGMQQLPSRALMVAGCLPRCCCDPGCRYELGRQAANTKLSSNVAVRRVRVRGGNYKFRALRLDHGNFSWGSEVRQRQQQQQQPAAVRAAGRAGARQASATSCRQPLLVTPHTALGARLAAPSRCCMEAHARSCCQVPAMQLVAVWGS